MPSLPPRNNRVLLAIDAIKEDIKSGKLSGKLPGERELAQRLRVSRKTLRKAVETMEKGRWIGPAHQGCRRQILKTFPIKQNHSPEPSLQGKSVITMAPRQLNQMGAIERLFQSDLNRYCERIGITLRHRHLDVRHMKRPAYRLQEYIQQNPADVYLLQHSSFPIQQWFDKHNIPSLVLGEQWEGIQLPGVSGDDEAVAAHAVALLRRHGHQRVAILYPDPAKRGLEVFVKKISQIAPDIDLSLVKHQETPESTRGAVTRLLTEYSQMPTAIFAPTIFSTLSVISTAGQHRLSIPGDLSLICLAHDEMLQYSQPSIAGYCFHWEKFAKTVLNTLSDLLLHPQSPVNQSVPFMPDFVMGESVAKAR